MRTLLIINMMLISGCGFARATEDDLRAALEAAEAAEVQAKQDAHMTWLNARCVVCTYSSCLFGTECQTNADDTCGEHAEAFCKSMGCTQWDTREKCETFIQICKEGKNGGY